MRKTFKDIDLQERFNKYGYVVIKNFLPKDEIDYLKEVYNETKNVITDKAFYISQWCDNQELKFKINDAVQKVLLKKAQSYLNDYIPVFGVFGVKHPGENSGMYLHGDWTHVDETKFRTVNVWSPLLDIDDNNGAICLLKGSNRLFNYIRGAAIPDTFHLLGEEKLQPYLTDIYMEAGDVIMWDHCIVHGSRINRSNESRVAAVLNLRPADSTFYLYFADSFDNINFIEVYEPPDDFFLKQDSANKSELIKQESKFIKKIPYENPMITEDDLIEFLNTEFPGEYNLKKPKKDFLNKLKAPFKKFFLPAKH